MVCVTDSGCSCITSSILRTNSLTGEYITGGERRGRGEGGRRGNDNNELIVNMHIPVMLRADGLQTMC